jgi:hypothetical protein
MIQKNENRRKYCGMSRLNIALLLFAFTVPAWACSPPPQREQSGFVRAEVNRLPKNARGVMFYPPSGELRTQDFSVTSEQDKRPLTVRIHRSKDGGWVRLEPVHGFEPNARYLFRYLPAHGNWIYPDKASVAIDDVVVDMRGGYALELAPRPVHRVIIVPTSSGSCVEPSPAVVQEFTYTIPSSLFPYRDLLDYGANISPISPGPNSRQALYIESWPDTPALYITGAYSLVAGYSTQYTARNNAVVAACGARQPLLKLDGYIGFPEVEMGGFRTPVTEVDLNQTTGEQCGQLETLVKTVDWKSPERSLRELCKSSLASSFLSGGALRAVEIEAWERELSFLYGMSPTCNFLALAHLWHTGQFSTLPDTLRTIGAALKSGLMRARPAEQNAALQALIYLLDQLPPRMRLQMTRQLLSPIQPVLVELLAAPQPPLPAAAASLIVRSGSLPPELQAKLRKLAGGRNSAASQARAILSTGLD